MAALASTDIPIAKEVPNPTAADIPLAQITSISPGESKESFRPEDKIKNSFLRNRRTLSENFKKSLRACAAPAEKVLRIKIGVRYNADGYNEANAKINRILKEKKLTLLIKAMKKNYKDLKKYENSEDYKKFVPESERMSLSNETDYLYEHFIDGEKWIGKYKPFPFSESYLGIRGGKRKKTRRRKRKSHKKRNKGKRKTKKRRKRKTKRRR